MDAPTATNRKRKRDDAHDENLKLTFSVADNKKSEQGPVFVSFPAMDAPKDVPFQAYESTSESVLNGIPKTIVIKGENPAIEFFGSRSDEREERMEQGFSCEYMVGIYDKATGTVRLHRAPSLRMSRYVKRLKNLKASKTSSAAQYAQARNQLGETFGNKKALKAIRAAERNRVDVSAMEGVTSFIQDAIETGTSALPSKEQAKIEADSSRPIPPVNLDATEPSEVYNVHDIALPSELSAISISPFTSATTLKERIALLPHRWSNWVNKQLARIFEAEKLNKTALKQLIFISCMFAFRAAVGKLKFDGREAVEQRLNSVPSIIVDGLFSRFTETTRGDTKPKSTSDTETRLLTHMFALCLRLENYSIIPGVIAGDLSLPPTKVVSLLKALGCQMVLMSAADREKAGLTLAEAKEQRRATLKLPLVFPVIKRSVARR